MSVRLTLALTSPFSTEEEVSWGSQPPVCLLGQECPSLAHLLHRPTSAMHPGSTSDPSFLGPLAACNWPLLFFETGHSEVRGWESQILSKQGCPVPQQEKQNKTRLVRGIFPSPGWVTGRFPRC